jgi:excisionase family DNA binding protein
MVDLTESRPLTPIDLAALMGCSRPVIDKALRDGVIPHLRLGRRIFIPRRVAAEMVENGRIPQAAGAPADGEAA